MIIIVAISSALSRELIEEWLELINFVLKQYKNCEKMLSQHYIYTILIAYF